MLENLILLAVYVIEAVKYCLGVYIVFHEKVERKWLYGVGGMVMVLYLFGIQPEVEKNSLVIFILIICLTLANVSGKIREKITKSLLLIVLVVNIDATVSTLTDQISNHIWKMKNSQIFLDCLWGFIVLTVMLGYKKKYIKFFQPPKDMVYFIVLFCGVLLAFTVKALNFATAYVDNERFQLFSAVVVTISYIGVCLLCWLMIHLRDQNEEMNKMLQVEKVLNEKQVNHYRKLLQKEEETRRFRHDIKNHLICMNMLASNEKYEELTEYLSQMNLEMARTETVKYYTGNEMVDIILNEKFSSCRKDIEIQVSGTVGNNIIVNDVDLCVILSNLLDNAIDAVERVRDGKRRISVKIFMGKQWMEFMVVNSTKDELTIDRSGLPVTTKEDKQMHGLGLGNVKRVVEKYGGELQCSIRDMMFTAKVYLPYDSRLGS